MRGDPRDTLIPQSRDGFEGMTYHEAAYRFWNMCRRVRDAADVDIAYSTTSVLADLIDPTCHAIEKGHPDEHHVCYGCNVCSFGWYESVNDEPYRYCPHCGARVVDHD